MHPLINIHLASAIPELKLCCRDKRKERSFSTMEPLIDMGLPENMETEGDLPIDPLNQSNFSVNLNKSRMVRKKSSLKPYMDFLKRKLRIDENYRRSAKDFDDPFIIYGYGVVAFFDLLRALIILFAVLSLIQLPFILSYYSYSDFIPS